MNIVHLGFLLLATLLSGCGQKTTLPTMELSPSRVVATVYAVRTDVDEIACYLAPDITSSIVAQLRNQQHVDLVSTTANMVQRGTDYWLPVYPRTGQRAACYVNIHHLMPVS